MKILEERCDVITNMEVMLLLVQQQELLPSVDSLLRCASKPSSSNSGSAAATVNPKAGPDREDGAISQGESAAERFKLEHVKDLLYQHMFNQMVQDYIRKTCPYLHLVRSPSDLRHPLDRYRSQQGIRNLTRRAPGSLAGGRRYSGITALRQGGSSPLISRRCCECLDALANRFGLTDLEMLTIINLGAYKPVEIYAFLEDCSNRFTEDDAAAMLSLIDLSLVQQQALPPLPATARGAKMDVEPQDGQNNQGGTAFSELEQLRQQQQELQEEARQLELQHQQVQQEADLMQTDPPRTAAGHKEEAKGQGAMTGASAPDGGSARNSTAVDLFAPANESTQPAGIDTFPAVDPQREAKPRGKAVRTATAKRRTPSRRKRVVDN